MGDLEKYIAGIIVIPLMVVAVVLGTLGFFMLQDGAEGQAPPEGEQAPDEIVSLPVTSIQEEGESEETETWEWWNMSDAENVKYWTSLSEEEKARFNELYWPESEWPREENFVPKFPEFAEYLVWYSEKKWRGGHGIGWWAVLDKELADRVFVYDKPSFSAKIVGEVVEVENMGDLWFGVLELYQTETELFIGEYYTEKEGYQWSLFSREGVAGWITSDLVRLSGV